MSNINVLKKFNLSKYHINKVKKSPKLYKNNLNLIKKYYKTKKKLSQIGGNKVDSELDNLLNMIDNLIKEKTIEIDNIKSNDIINNKNIKDLQQKYDFLEAFKDFITNMITLYVNSHILNDIVNILSDQLDVISKVSHGKSSTKKFKTDEKVMIDNILKNNERIHPDILSKVINAEKARLDLFFNYIQILDNLLRKNFNLNPRTKKYKLLWNYKTDTDIIKLKTIELKQKINEFKSAIDFKYLLMLLEENLNIFDGCYCNSKCSYQDKSDTAHWCYTQHERCKRGNQSKTFGNPTKTCNPFKNNKGKITTVDRDFYKIGLHHNIAYKTNRAIICTTKINGITKHTGNYKCSPSNQEMSIKDFIKLKKQEYKKSYSNNINIYFKDLKKELLNHLKINNKNISTQTVTHKNKKIRQRKHPDADILGKKFKPGKPLISLKGGKKSKNNFLKNLNKKKIKK